VRTLGSGTFARYLANGDLVFFDESRMMAARFDPEAGRLTSPPIRLTGCDASGRWGHRTFAVSARGLLVLAQPPPTRVLRIGQRGDSTPIDLPRATYLEPNISTDGRRLAVSAAIGGGSSAIWVFELRGGETTRVELTERGENSSPVFSNDGDQVFFWSERDGRRGLYRKRIEDSGAPLALSEREEGRPTEISPDGRWIATSLSNDVWLVSTETGEPEPLAVTHDAEGAAVFSPDGEWVAYMVTSSPRTRSESRPPRPSRSTASRP
jgi:Tol biopolymer transport system component